ncbi:MAG: glucose-6-phosphate isomerase, partial [Gammaproteobacteria bacterium]|nr:glucose-6-phosphate isomerase [Gemmatimonadota bacterium]NIU78261.1 glucose-6-phosphate isomerase [Gammaproteobacteria bacterium]
FVEGHGLDRDWLDELAEGRFPAVHEAAVEGRRAGRLGFYGLPDGGDLVERIREFADGAGQAFENVVVLGIGGSALGTITLRDALLGPHWNELDA